MIQNSEKAKKLTFSMYFTLNLFFSVPRYCVDCACKLIVGHVLVSDTMYLSNRDHNTNRKYRTPTTDKYHNCLSALVFFYRFVCPKKCDSILPVARYTYTRRKQPKKTASPFVSVVVNGQSNSEPTNNLCMLLPLFFVLVLVLGNSHPSNSSN